MLTAKMESQYSAIISFTFNMKFCLSNTERKKCMTFDIFLQSLQIETWHLHVLVKGVCVHVQTSVIKIASIQWLTRSETLNLCFNNS